MSEHPRGAMNKLNLTLRGEFRSLEEETELKGHVMLVIHVIDSFSFLQDRDSRTPKTGIVRATEVFLWSRTGSSVVHDIVKKTYNRFFLDNDFAW